MPFLDILNFHKNDLEFKLRQIFSDVPVLETERLIMTKIEPHHAEDMYEYSCDPLVTRFLTWSCHSSVKETERYIKLLQKKYQSGAFRDFGLVHKESGKFIGTCGFTSVDTDEYTAEIGYVLNRDFWGMGLAAEATKRLMEFGKEVFGLRGYCAKCMEGNDGSMAVMKKVGMSFDAMYKNSAFIKGEYKTIIVYKTNY